MIRKLFALLVFLAFPGVAQADWYEAGTEHFVVYSNDNPDRIKQFATNLERFDQALRAYSRVKDENPGAANRVTVYVVDNVAKIRALSGDNFVAGFYIPRAGESVAFVPRVTDDDSGEFSPLVILLHEYTHHFMFSSYPDAAYPAWFSEGYAEVYATAKFQKDGSVDFGYAPQYRRYGLLDGNALPIQKLLTSDALKLTDEQREALYGRGWLLIHYLHFGHAREGQLGAYINAINQGKAPLEAAQIFGDLRAFDKELEHYKQGRFSGWHIPASAIQVGNVTVRKLGAGEAATMDVRIKSDRGVDEKTAPAVYESAKKACAPYPNDPAAQLVLAEAAYDAGDYTASEAAADRALAANPKAMGGYLYKAMSQMARATKAKDHAPQTWAAIRKIISTGNHLDPDDPRPLILFYESYADNGERPTKNVRDGLYYASLLAPEDRSLRFNAAESYLAENNLQMARVMLLPLAFDPHNSGLAAAATKSLAEIDRRTGATGAKPAEATPPPKP
jgi:tetratricopeptide (TPR) repeat protein